MDGVKKCSKGQKILRIILENAEFAVQFYL